MKTPARSLFAVAALLAGHLLFSPRASAQPAVPSAQEASPEATAGAAPKAATATKPAADPLREALLQKKLERYLLVLHVRPEQPLPGALLQLTFDLYTRQPAIDPTFGDDREPLAGQELFVTVQDLERNQIHSRHRLLPLAEPGTYGMHTTLMESGLYRLDLSQSAEVQGKSAAPLKADFTIGVGVPTPASRAADSESSDYVQPRRGKVALRSIQAGGGSQGQGARSAQPLMRELGARWLALSGSMSVASEPAQRSSAAEAIAALAERTAKEPPSGLGAGAEEYGALAAELAGATQQLPSAAAEPAKGRAAMEQLELASCAKCHAKFRFKATGDLSKWPAAAPLASQAPLAAPAKERPVMGDLAHGRALYRFNCAACHGAEAKGDGPLAAKLGAKAPALREPLALLAHTNDELRKAIAEGAGDKSAAGGLAMPAFSSSLEPLDLADLIAWLRSGGIDLEAQFPMMARYHMKDYVLTPDREQRVAPVIGKFQPGEKEVPLLAIFKGERGQDGSVVRVSHEPRALDTLRPTNKLGYFTCLPLAALPGAGKTTPTCIALASNGSITSMKVAPGALPEAAASEANKLLATFVGLGSKGGDLAPLKPKSLPKGVKMPPELASSVNRVYYRTMCAATLFDREELERNQFD